MQRSPIKFPYRIYKGITSPIIGFEIRGPKGWIGLEAYVDSGASVSVFTADEAQNLGINIKKGKIIYSTVGDGGSIPVYLFTLPVKLGSISFSATVGFSPRLGIGFNLLGRKDFFTRFDITFSDATRTITFIPRR